LAKPYVDVFLFVSSTGGRGRLQRVAVDWLCVEDVCSNDCRLVLVFEESNYEYKSGTRKKLEILAKVVEVVTS